MDFAFALNPKCFSTADTLDAAFNDYCQREGIPVENCSDFLKNGNLFYLTDDCWKGDSPIKTYGGDWDWDNVIVD